MSNSIYRQWAYQPLSLPDADETQYVIYRVRERRDGRGQVVEERLEAMPGTFPLFRAEAIIAVTNSRDVVPKMGGVK